MGTNTSQAGMGADPFAAIAVDLNEDAKAARRKKPDAPEAAEGTLADALVSYAKSAKFAGASLADDLMRAMLEQFKHRPKPFGQMTEGEQSDVVAALTESATEFVDKAIKLFAAEDRPNVHAKVKSLNADGGKTKLVLEVMGETAEDIASIYRVLSKDVVVILADANEYMSRGDAADLIEADQQDMSFEADEQREHPEDSSDLAD